MKFQGHGSLEINVEGHRGEGYRDTLTRRISDESVGLSEWPQLHSQGMWMLHLSQWVEVVTSGASPRETLERYRSYTICIIDAIHGCGRKYG